MRIMSLYVSALDYQPIEIPAFFFKHNDEFSTHCNYIMKYNFILTMISKLSHRFSKMVHINQNDFSVCQPNWKTIQTHEIRVQIQMWSQRMWYVFVVKIPHIFHFIYFYFYFFFLNLVCASLKAIRNLQNCRGAYHLKKMTEITKIARTTSVCFVCVCFFIYFFFFSKKNQTKNLFSERPLHHWMNHLYK